MFFKNRQSHDARKGQELFERGMLAASRYECDEAIKLYTASIEANPNPAPYINRAKLFSLRLRHYEALQDLQKALELDLKQGREFQNEIGKEIELSKVMTVHYGNGLRERLIDDLESNGHIHVGKRILSSCSENNLDLIEHHFFNEIDNIKKFDGFDANPEACEYCELYPQSFIDEKLVSCPSPSEYEMMRMKYESFLCAYPPDKMTLVRRGAIYDAHDRLLSRDWGDMYMAFGSDCPGVIRQAAHLIPS